MTEVNSPEIPQQPAKVSNNPDVQHRVENYVENHPRIKRVPPDQRVNVARDYVARDLVSERAGQIDTLTGIYNRKGFDARLGEETKRIIRSDPAAHLEAFVIMLDVNYLKSVNDGKGGHQAGDELLKTVARVIKKTRDTDTAARLGGDEFAIILETNPDGVRAWWDRVSEELRQAQELMEKEGIPVALSAGAAMLHPFDTDGSIKTADQAMYDAKKLKKDMKSHFFITNEENNTVEYIASKEKKPTPAFPQKLGAA